MKKLLTIAVLFIIALQFHACDDIDILSPPGPAGMSAYKEWVKAVEAGEISWSSGTDLANFFKFLKGDKGEAGASAYASWVELIKTGTVENPHKPGSKWDPSKDAPSDFYSFLTGAKGDAGLTPHINANGNWQIGTVDTGIPAKGQPGAPGLPGTAGSVVEINDAGNWEIDGADTGLSAQGKDGVGGTDGKSAYEIWVAEVEAGNIKDKDGNLWPPGSTTLGDFWSYLSGASAEPKDTTLLKHIKSELDPDDINYEFFEFETDPGAVVTMQYGNNKVSEPADTEGKCIIRFKNRLEGDTPVLVSAIKVGKNPSMSLLLVVKVQLPYFKFSDQVIWYDKDDNVLTEASGEYRPNDQIPFLSLEKAGSEGNYVKLPIDMDNVKEVYLSYRTNTEFRFDFVWEDEDMKKGYILLENAFLSATSPIVSTITTLQIVGLNDYVVYKQIKLQATF